jgi:hypothetical protein
MAELFRERAAGFPETGVRRFFFFPEGILTALVTDLAMGSKAAVFRPA